MFSFSDPPLVLNKLRRRIDECKQISDVLPLVAGLFNLDELKQIALQKVSNLETAPDVPDFSKLFLKSTSVISVFPNHILTKILTFTNNKDVANTALSSKSCYELVNGVNGVIDSDEKDSQAEIRCPALLESYSLIAPDLMPAPHMSDIGVRVDHGNHKCQVLIPPNPESKQNYFPRFPYFGLSRWILGRSRQQTTNMICSRSNQFFSKLQQHKQVKHVSSLRFQNIDDKCFKMLPQFKNVKHLSFDQIFWTYVGSSGVTRLTQLLKQKLDVSQLRVVEFDVRELPDPYTRPLCQTGSGCFTCALKSSDLVEDHAKTNKDRIVQVFDLLSAQSTTKPLNLQAIIFSGNYDKTQAYYSGVSHQTITIPRCKDLQLIKLVDVDLSINLSNFETGSTIGCVEIVNDSISRILDQDKKKRRGRSDGSNNRCLKIDYVRIGYRKTGRDRNASPAKKVVNDIARYLAKSIQVFCVSAFCQGGNGDDDIEHVSREDVRKINNLPYTLMSRNEFEEAVWKSCSDWKRFVSM